MTVFFSVMLKSKNRKHLELTSREGCESLVLLPLGSVTLPSLRQPPYGRVSERVILRNDTESNLNLNLNPALGLPAG